MALSERSRRFYQPKRKPFPDPVNFSLCCAAPVRIAPKNLECTRCGAATEAVQVRHLGNVHGARLRDLSALGIDPASAVEAIREMCG